MVTGLNDWVEECCQHYKKGIYHLPDKGAKMSLSGCLKLVAFHAILIV